MARSLRSTRSPAPAQEHEGVSLAELAELSGARLIGDAGLRVHQVAPLDTARPGQISFLANSRYRRHLASTGASAVILAEADREQTPLPVLVSANPYLAYARIARRLNPVQAPRAGVHPTAWVHPEAVLEAGAAIGPQASVAAGARIGAGASVGANAVIGEDVHIGDDSRIGPNVTVYAGCRVGRRVTIHAGAVIGADGFGFANDGGRWEKVPQLGGVRIGDDVEIGANTAVDRGALGDTVIEEGVKLDNLVQIAHNVRVGAHTIMAGTAAVSGSTRIGARCMIAGGAGFVGHLEIADGTVVTGMTMVTHDIREAGVYSSGTQMAPGREWRRNAVRFQQLDEMARRLRELERQVAELRRGPAASAAG